MAKKELIKITILSNEERECRREARESECYHISLIKK